MDKMKSSNRNARARSLTLKKEFIRILQKHELATVGGGAVSAVCSVDANYSSALATMCSDRRLKKSIRRIPRALDIIALL